MSFDTYSICEDVPGALPRTHPTIVATITSPASPTSTIRPTTVVATEPETTATSPTTHLTSTKSVHTSTTLTTFQSPTPTTQSTQDPSTETDKPTSTESDSSPSATSSEDPAEPGQGSKLNSGAVIGVSVASGIAGFFILGVIIFFCCRKARRKAQDREFFEIGGHMTEPPDFSFPPKRPPMGPRPSPAKVFGPDSESIRLVSPEEAEYQHPSQYPAVVITRPDEDYNYGRMSENNTGRVGFQSSSNLDFDAESTASSRTVSDLLPDKPTYELYPRPLRWSQHKKFRSSSGATLFEEHSRGPRPLPHPPVQQSSFTPTNTRGQNSHPLAGLPANPRAMMYGFAGPGQTPPMRGLKHEKRPIGSNSKEKALPAVKGASPYPSGHSPIDYDDDLDNYWKNSDAGFVGAKVIQPQPQPHSYSIPRGTGTNRNSVGDYLGYEFEFGFGESSSSSGSRRASRYSGGFRPLTPVTEIRTPMGELQNPMGESSNHQRGTSKTPSVTSKTARNLPTSGTSGTGPGGPPHPPQPPQEIVSRPRIVRQDDIKRVQIHRGKPLPPPKDSEVTVPYGPDDFWYEPGAEPSSSSAYRLPVPKNAVEYRHLSKGMLGGMPKKKPSPLERNLTPSRRGADLILQVE
ncbi:uncharacterized protein DSM5745_03448 [Aspergillus mulundensis]|uniref:Uncharacterized protein n=1 Tax=Aspergillus mulundensis TaxID=1810919 RepID=A0A3D8SKK0_9EURO|nr:Uncharacterized protein DSM5745_03448 [Aspergillus mulundensis]RDW86806.1 Uncharacterized protein DSM5745_03448 [Aspergillus mulundensis]